VEWWFQARQRKYGDPLSRSATGQKPVINLYHHVDSLLQARRDIDTIHKAMKNGLIDTTGSVNGVYYKILKEGNGDQVSVNDTLSVFYKGWILNGGVFDSTEKEPITFPLTGL